MVKICYDCTRAEFDAGRKLLFVAQKAANKEKNRTAGWRGPTNWILLVVLLVPVFLCEMPSKANSEAFKLWGTYASVAGGVTLYLFCRLGRLLVWSNFRETCRDQTVIIADEHLTQNWPGIRLAMHWQHFAGFAESESAFILKKRSGEAFVLPKRVFASEDLETTRSILTNKLTVPATPLTDGSYSNQ